MDSLFISQFVLLAAAHALAVISPGPDFAVVVKQSISFGRRHALYTSVGIGSAISIHVLYSVLGIGLLISQSQFLFSLLKYLCAGYLIYIGIGALRAKPHSAPELDVAKPVIAKQPLSKAFALGFITNVLNPKATLFFLSIFSVIVTRDTPLSWLVIYAVYLVCSTALWFCFVSLILTKAAVRRKFLRLGHYFDRIMGGLLIALGIKVGLSSL